MSIAREDVFSPLGPTSEQGGGGAAPTWSSTDTPVSMAAALKGLERAVVLTHARPDGDAVGSSLAMVRALRKGGTDAAAWFVGPMPRWATTIIDDTPVKILDVHAISAGALKDAPEPDGVVIVDTGAWAQVEELRAWIEPRSAKTCVIDHHLSGNADIAHKRLIDTGAAAAGEIVAAVVVAMLGVSGANTLPVEIAEPLYLGMGTDTGWFKFSNTRPATMRFAADMMEAGVDHAKLYQMVEQQDRVARLKLLGRAMSSLELLKGDSIALMRLTQKDFEECHGDAEDTTGFASYALDAAAVQVAVLMTEVAGREGKGPITKVSFRSKPGPNAVDVAAICRSMGGGGHARAAGLKLMMPMEPARAALAKALGV